MHQSGSWRPLSSRDAVPGRNADEAPRRQLAQPASSAARLGNCFAPSSHLNDAVPRCTRYNVQIGRIEMPQEHKYPHPPPAIRARIHAKPHVAWIPCRYPLRGKCSRSNAFQGRIRNKPDSLASQLGTAPGRTFTSSIAKLQPYHAHLSSVSTSWSTNHNAQICIFHAG